MSFRFKSLRPVSFLGLTCILLCAGWQSIVSGQAPKHRLLRSDMPPGMVGRIQAQSVPSRFGYFQPVEVRVPEGALISVASDGTFGSLGPSARAALQLGHVYRLKVSNIPQHETTDLFPSVEIIDRLHPPAGEAERFPIPIEITQDDLEAALRGAMIVRVIYLENPATALPVSDPREQISMDVGPGEDPLSVADEQGRPMAILRLGSRVESAEDGDESFFFGCPPLHWLSNPVESAIPSLGEPVFGSTISVTPPRFVTRDGVEPRPTSRPELATTRNEQILKATHLELDESTLDTLSRSSVPTATRTSATLPGLTAPPCGCQHGDDEGPIFRSCDGDCDGQACEWPADEYLCDGGDQETQVTLSRHGDLRGLDPEDTVAHYDTLDGRTLIHPSNNVCIYAPRFAAVRKVVATSEDLRLLTMESLESPLPPLTDYAPLPPRQIEQPLPPLHVAGLRGALALRERAGGMEFMQVHKVMELAKDFAPHEDFQIIRTGIHQRSQRALVEEHAEAALVWSDYLAPEIILLDEPAEVDTTVEKPSTIHHLDDRGHPKIRVLKLASTKSARPGEEVEFTLRFDNVGDQPIAQVTLVDRLTTRLEYVPDSAQSSLEAKFTTAPHDTDSLTLRWEIQEPLKPGQGGILRFRTKVR